MLLPALYSLHPINPNNNVVKGRNKQGRNPKIQIIGIPDLHLTKKNSINNHHNHKKKTLKKKLQLPYLRSSSQRAENDINDREVLKTADQLIRIKGEPHR